MKEENVLWVGTQPIGEKTTPVLADDASFVAAITTVCEATGCRVHQFISALGPYGTWLVEIWRDGQDQRIFWNGKAARLVLQVSLSQGGWEDSLTIEVATLDTDGFVAAVTELL